MTQWRIVYNKQKLLSPAAQTFLTYLKEHKEAIIARHFSEYITPMSQQQHRSVLSAQPD